MTKRAWLNVPSQARARQAGPPVWPLCLAARLFHLGPREEKKVGTPGSCVMGWARWLDAMGWTLTLIYATLLPQAGPILLGLYTANTPTAHPEAHITRGLNPHLSDTNLFRRRTRYIQLHLWSKHIKSLIGSKPCLAESYTKLPALAWMESCQPGVENKRGNSFLFLSLVLSLSFLFPGTYHQLNIISSCLSDQAKIVCFLGYSQAPLFIRYDSQTSNQTYPICVYVMNHHNASVMLLWCEPLSEVHLCWVMIRRLGLLPKILVGWVVTVLHTGHESPLVIGHVLFC